MLHFVIWLHKATYPCSTIKTIKPFIVKNQIVIFKTDRAISLESINDLLLFTEMLQIVTADKAEQFSVQNAENTAKPVYTKIYIIFFTLAHNML